MIGILEIKAEEKEKFNKQFVTKVLQHSGTKKKKKQEMYNKNSSLSKNIKFLPIY